MAPSRGFTALRYAILGFRNTAQRYHSTFPKTALDPSRKAQIYISRSIDPYVNLSTEHFLLQRSPPDSIILFLYTNRPCIVIGRNQNPWVEVNLGLLNRTQKNPGKAGDERVSLVRRRSGGGTVFHDEGNVNYSVICPTAAFDRDKHAKMVVRALHRLGVREAKVNKRHDIVLDLDWEETYKSTSERNEIGHASSRSDRQPLKVSGSAYKLTRLRSLHHGTCLLSSPNISQISQYLRSPAKPYIKARGVDSVSSPITNVKVSNEAFENAVVAEFGMMYGPGEPMILTDEASEVPEIAKGLAEMGSLEWTYMQTPQFTFSSHPTKDDPRIRPPLPAYISEGVALSFTARNGIITQADISLGGMDRSVKEGPQLADASALIQRRLHTVEDWQAVLPEPLTEERYGISRWLNELFGKGSCG